MKNKHGYNYLRKANGVGLFFVILFIVCFIWYFIHPVEQGLHLSLLKLSYLGFKGMDFAGFILGIVQSYLWAYLAVGIWFMISCCCKTCKICEEEKKEI